MIGYNGVMEKTLFLTCIFLASVLVGCGKYASQKQAEAACDEWKEKGERIDYLVHFNDADTYEKYVTDRTCKLEEATRRFLGFQGELSRKQREVEGERIYYQDAPEPINLKAIKSFYY